jgi:hypothetical protein
VLDAARDAFLKNSENTNTQERRALKAVWDILIEPTVNAMLFASPVSLASAAITQAAGSGDVRDKLLVDPLAGEAKPRRRMSGSHAGRAGRSGAGCRQGRSGRSAPASTTTTLCARLLTMRRTTTVNATLFTPRLRPSPGER